MTATTRLDLATDVALGAMDDADGDARLMRLLDVLLDRLRGEPHAVATDRQRAAAKRLAMHVTARRRATERATAATVELLDELA